MTKKERYRVAAFKDGVFDHWASEAYESFEAAFAYCSECIRVCSEKTRMRYQIERTQG